MAVNLKDQRGIALLLTITLIGLITVLTMEFIKSVRSGLYETAGFDDSVRLAAIAKSGYNCALAVLHEDDADADSLHDDWASLDQYSMFSTVLFDNDGLFTAQITDLSGKIQINRLINLTGTNKGEYDEKQKAMLSNLLKIKMADFDMEESDVNDILDAIKDWIDEDDEVTGFGGAEDSYYQSLDTPYSCRNAPLESIEELLLVNGITPELLYGDEDTKGISSYLTTVIGDGRININTADPVVLEAMSEDLDSTMIEEITAYRDNEDNDLDKSDWYKTALGTSEDYIDPTLITIKSSFFRITSMGIRDDRSSGIIGDVARSGKTLTALSYKMF